MIESLTRILKRAASFVLHKSSILGHAASRLSPDKTTPPLQTSTYAAHHTPICSVTSVQSSVACWTIADMSRFQRSRATAELVLSPGGQAIPRPIDPTMIRRACILLANPTATALTAHF
jgi:hypothetical protein